MLKIAKKTFSSHVFIVASVFLLLSQLMVAIQFGDHTEHVQSLVVVEPKLDEGLAPTHPLLPEEKTAAIWERVLRPENATTRSVLVNYLLMTPIE